MRRLLVPVLLIALAAVLLLVLRDRKRAFIAAQVQLLQSDDPQEATDARKRLQRIGRSAVRPVCALLEHEDEEVRARAARCLVNIGNPAACGPLMEAAKRGDFPAADALATLGHPRANEATAWALCRLGDRVLQDLQRRVPVGCPMPRRPWIWYGHPYLAFGPKWRSVIQWPCEFAGAGEGQVYSDVWRWLEYACGDADYQYEAAFTFHALPEAVIGRARLRELCGDYAAAGHFYARALALAPDSEAAKAGEARAGRSASVARAMERVLGAGYHVDRFLHHPTWCNGPRTYCVAVVSWPHETPSPLSVAPKLALFSSGPSRLEKLHVVRAYSAQEQRDAWAPSGTLKAYVGVAEAEPGQPAQLVVIRAYVPENRPLYLFDVLMFRPVSGKLTKTLSLPSRAVPWVTDLDRDGDPEIVVFRDVGSVSTDWQTAPYPTVYTLVNGRYEPRSEQFPSVFEVAVPILLQREREYPKEPGIPEHLGRAYEILGKKGLAVAAYERAERRYAANGDQKGASAVRQRRLRAEGELAASPGA